MSTILDSLSRLNPQPLGLVVHVGAGGGDVLDAYAALAPRRLVLVEGDPDTLAELRAGVAARADGKVGAKLVAEVVGEVVAPKAGELRWHRFNLRQLNAPFEPTALRRVYPRLALLDSPPVMAVALADVLAPLVAKNLSAKGAAAGPAVLVLDVPGQEAALLAALPAELLQSFQWLVLRGCREPLVAPTAGDISLAQRMAVRFFRAAGADTESEPLWPLSLWQFDEAGFERAALRDRCRALEVALADGETQLKAVAAERQAWAAEKGKLQAEHAGLAKERAEALSQRDAAAKERNGLLAARDEQVRLVAEREEQLKAAQTEKARLQPERDRLLKENTEALALRDAIAKERGALVAARDEQAKLATDRGKRITTLEAELVDLKARHAMLQEELLKAEAQIELIKDLLLREPAL